MPDSRTRRGPHPKDAECFKPGALPVLRTALDELCWLLSRGYPGSASLKLVGDRHLLRTRQRQALQRCAASEKQCERRRRHEVDPGALRDQVLLVDGYNVLLSVEAALGGGVLLRARDGTLRDMAAMSGHYRRVDATRPALERIAQLLHAQGWARVIWYFDRPVSNSGRLKALMGELAASQGWPWEVRLVANPDPVLARSSHIIASADSAILDRCQRWVNLARQVVESSVPEAWILDLG